MRSYPSARSRLTAGTVAVLLLLGFALGAVACTSRADEGPSGPTGETTPYVPETLPDLTDDREPTSVADYARRIETAFSTTQPAPVEQFTYTVDDDGVTITGYIGGEVVVVIPDTMEGKPVLAIAEGAFAGKGTLQALAIPDSVVAIGIGALSGCKSLATLRTPVYTCHTAPYFGALFGATSYEINAAHVPGTLSTLILTGGTVIPDYAFYDTNLEAVSLPAEMSEIGDFAFYGNDRLVYMPLAHTQLTAIGARALANCTALLSLELPATLERAGLGMLEGCGKLETLTLPFVGGTRDGQYTETGEEDEEITVACGYLGYLFGAADYAFSAGYIPASLIRVTLLEGCEEIPPNAFFECASIREVVIPAGVTAIGYRAFYECRRLSSVALPATLTTIGDDAFHGCMRLVAVSGGEGLQELGIQAFTDCVSLVELTLPATVTYLPNACFAGCTSLTAVTAPGVTDLGRQVFRHCPSLQGWAEETETQTTAEPSA